MTGLTKLVVLSLPKVDATNPFDGVATIDALVLPGVFTVEVTVTPTDAGTTKTVDVPVLNLGGVQAFACACNDE